MTNNTLLPCVEINPAQKPIASIIWLHGLGATGHDFAAALPHLNLPPELPIRFVFPHAPTRPVTLNGGFHMPAWYDIFGLKENTQQDEMGIKNTEEKICALMENEIAQGIPSDHLFLAGFSQGGAIALHTSLRYPKRLAGVIALSTYLPLEDQVHSNILQQDKTTPYLFSHGEKDDLVPMAWGKKAAAYLTDLGYENITWHDYPMKHEVCLTELNDISVWIQKILS